MSPPSIIFLFCVAIFLLFIPIHAFSEATVQNNIQVSQEYDDNARREETGDTQDFLIRFLYRLDVRASFKKDQKFSTQLEIGGKKYLSILDVEGLKGDSVIGKLDGAWQWSFLEKMGLKIDEAVEGRYIRDFNENSFDNNGNLLFYIALPWHFSAQLSCGYVFFDYDDTTAERFHFLGDRYVSSLGRPIGNVLTTGIGYAIQRRFFSFNAEVLVDPEAAQDTNPDGTDIFEEPEFQDLDERRLDYLHEFTGYFQYARRFVARLSYTLQLDESNSYRGSFLNHRVQMNLSLRLFSPLTFLALGKFQFKKYEDPALVSKTISIDEDTEEPTIVLQRFENQNENLSSLEFKLVYPIADDLFMDVTYSYFFLFQEEQNSYYRNLAGLGIRKRF